MQHRLTALFGRHPHSSDKVDAALENSREGLRALWLSLACLGITAVLQGTVAVWSGSVALLGDTLHNIANALTTLPIAVAFVLRRRPATLRYSHGYGRGEDVTGVLTIAMIAGSAALVGYAAVDRLLHPAPVEHLPAVAMAAIIGITGNELVVQMRIWVGRRIGSPALVADGLRARANGWTSLAVLVAAAGTLVGLPWADPLMGLAITVAILLILWRAGAEMYLRLMDAVDPAILAACDQTLRASPGVRDVTELRLRWVGHRLRADGTVAVNPRLTVVEAHRIVEDARHRLVSDVPRLRSAVVHAVPEPAGGDEPLESAAHHSRRGGWPQ